MHIPSQSGLFAWSRQNYEIPSAVAKELAHVFLTRIGDDVEILGLAAEQQVAHTAADQEGLIAMLVETVEDFERVAGNIRCPWSSSST